MMDTENTEATEQHQGAHGDAGAASSEDLREGLEGAGEDAEGGDADDEGEGEATGRDPIQGLKRRLQKVIAQRNEERSKNQTLAEKAAAYDRAVAAYQRQQEEEQARTEEQTGVAARKRALRELVEQTYGEGASSVLDGGTEAQRQVRLMTAQRGEEVLRDVLAQHRVELRDKADYERWEAMVTTVIQSDENAAKAFMDPTQQRAVVEHAFSYYRDHYLNPLLASIGARKLERVANVRAAQPLAAARGTSLPKAIETEFKPKSKDPVERAKEWDAEIARRWEVLDQLEG